MTETLEDLQATLATLNEAMLQRVAHICHLAALDRQIEEADKTIAAARKRIVEKPLISYEIDETGAVFNVTGTLVESGQAGALLADRKVVA